MSNKTTVTATPGESTIHIERIFDAPKEKLWKAMSTPDLIEKWWTTGPDDYVTVEEFEPKEGGKWRYVQHKGGQEFAFYGVIHEHGPDRVVQTFEFSGLPERGHVIMEKMTMEALDDNKTKLSVVQAFFSSQERDGMLASGMEEGMNSTYRVLEELAKTL